jgi:hypothetical protein
MSHDDALGAGVPAQDRPLSGTLIYEYVPHLTIFEVVEYGVSADAVLSGNESPPSEGARFDFHLQGEVVGPNLEGSLKGVDYVAVRADGRVELHIHACITTSKGERIALIAGGIAFRKDASHILELRENVTLLSNHRSLSWLNGLQIWASGKVDMSVGHVWIEAIRV